MADAQEIKTCCGGSSNTKTGRSRPDYLLFGSLVLVGMGYVAAMLFVPHNGTALSLFVHAIHEMVHLMWWGILLGMVAVGVIDRVPRTVIIGIVGRKQGARSLLRAVLAGLFLDLCNHGILMVGAKLYERGASLGQVFAFLIASPWNSLSMTLLIGILMGWEWMIIFILASLFIAFVTGLIIEAMERRGMVSPNPNRIDIPEDFDLWGTIRTGIKTQRYDGYFVKDVARRSVTASRMILRWIFFGIVLSAAVKAFVSTDIFATWFAPTILGLLATLIAATVIEVCSEGSIPLSADLMNRAEAPGNAFTFLMAGAATDYTEILVLKQVTGRLAAALLLPLLTVPQVLVIGYWLNG